MSKSKLVIDSNKKFLPMLQCFVMENIKLFHLLNLSEKLMLCSEEAFIYILNTSFRSEDGELSIDITVNEFYLILSFKDKGLPFDISLTQDYKIEESLQNISTDGLELFLMKQFSSKIEWLNHGNRGKELKLYFEIPHADIVTLIQNKNEHKIEIHAELDDIEIKTFQEKDAVRISQIIYKTYGYTYPNEDLYYPQKIINLNKSAKLISIVAYDKKRDDIVGHYALERDDLGSVAEIGQAVVDPNYRGLGLMKLMRKKVGQTAVKIGLEGIISQPVTTHTFSQKVNEGVGATAIGFSYGVVPQKQSFKAIKSKLTQRESCMLYFLPLKKRARRLYFPKKHNQILHEIYMNLEFEYSVDDKKSQLENGAVKSFYSKNFEVGYIYVQKIGADNFQSIQEALYNLQFRMKADVIFIYINLEDANIEELTQQIEKEKFFFAGIMPSILNGKDVIRYEYLRTLVENSEINIYSDRARSIFEYISNQRTQKFNK